MVHVVNVLYVLLRLDSKQYLFECLIAGVAVVDDEGPHPKLVHLLLAFLVLICFLDSCD